MESNTVKTESDALNEDNVTRLPVENTRDESHEEESRPDYLRDVTEHFEKDTSVLGSDLRTARVKLGEDIQTIATALNIRAAHLEALESGDIGALPGRAYALGFVRSYATYLGLDSDASVARFKLETDRQEEEAAALAFPEANQDVRMPQGSLTVIAILLVAAILGGLQLSQMVDRMLTEDPGSPPAVAAPSQPAADPAATEDLSALETPPSDGDVATVETAGGSETGPVSADAAVDTNAAPQTSTETGTGAPEATPPAAAAPPLASPEQVFGANPADSRVMIVARGNAWLRIDNPQSGAVLIQTTLRSGDQFYVPNEAGLVMAARNAKNLEIFVDGASVGLAGTGVLVEKALDADQLISPTD